MNAYFDLLSYSNMANPKVFLDIAIGTRKSSKLIFELFANVVPRTAENFRCLCTGEKGKNKSGIPLHYKGSFLHRIIPEFMCQGGDFTVGNGTGGESIYGKRFDDENFTLTHDMEGILSMANAGPNTNGSQFFITTVPTPHLDGRHVVFGKLISGIDYLHEIESIGSYSGKPKYQVKICDCGEFKEKK